MDCYWVERDRRWRGACAWEGESRIDPWAGLAASSRSVARSHDTLHNAGAHTECPTDLQDAHAFGPKLAYARFHRRLDWTAAKRRGTNLGSNRGVVPSKKIRAMAVQALRSRADSRAADLAPIIADLQAAGKTSRRAIADELNSRHPDPAVVASGLPCRSAASWLDCRVKGPARPPGFVFRHAAVGKPIRRRPNPESNAGPPGRILR
jgi:hypothetical protein